MGDVGEILGAGITGAMDYANSRVSAEEAKELNAQQHQYNLEMAERQFQYNRDAQEYAYEKNLEQWMRENEYNTPAAQMERYKAAGLNPQLIYGKSNESAPSPTFTPAEYREQGVNLQKAHVSIPQALSGALSAYYDISLKRQQLSNMEAQRRQMLTYTSLMNAQTVKQLYDNKYSASTLGNKIAMAGYQADVMKYEAEAAEKRVDDIIASTNLKIAELENLKISGTLNKKQIHLVNEQIQNEKKRREEMLYNIGMLEIKKRRMQQGIDNAPYGVQMIYSMGEDVFNGGVLSSKAINNYGNNKHGSAGNYITATGSHFVEGNKRTPYYGRWINNK